MHKAVELLLNILTDAEYGSIFMTGNNHHGNPLSHSDEKSMPCVWQN
jgi:hypothetical protein